MFLRIIHGKLKPGTWSEFESAYKGAMQDAGVVPGLRGRWLTRDLDDPDAGTTISLWATQGDLDAYEKSDLLTRKITPQLSPFFSGDYRTTKSEIRFSEGDSSPRDWVAFAQSKAARQST
jgi:heme-degrading monooxygenase HmoA